MKTFMPLAVLPICLFLLFVFSCGGQTGMNGRFVSGEGGFAISLPEKPSERKSVDFTILKYDVSGEIITWSEIPDFFATVENYKVYSDNAKLSPLEKTNILQTHKKGFTDALTKAGIKYTETPFKFQLASGYEIHGSSASGKMVSRGFFVNNRIIILGVIKRTGENFNSQLELVNSFRLLTKAERVVALIAENLLKDLPQSPAAARPLTDAQKNNLKGRVKSVVEESQETPKAAREFYSEDNYDESGNLLKHVSSFGGYPEEIEVWGWIDGMRVSRGKFVEYALDEGPNENGVQSITEAAPAESGAPKKVDERFGSRYQYKYDDKNRITEEKTFSNDGTLTTTQNISYAENRRDTITRNGAKGEFSIRFVETLDAGGNIIEDRYYDSKNKPDGEATVYQYEQDARGNWTVQKSFEKKTVKGKAVLKPQAVHFRKISYYE